MVFFWGGGGVVFVPIWCTQETWTFERLNLVWNS